MAYREGGSGDGVPPKFLNRIYGLDNQIDSERMMIAALQIIEKIKSEGFSVDDERRKEQEGLIMLIYLCEGFPGNGDPKIICEGIYRKRYESHRVYWFRRN